MDCLVFSQGWVSIGIGIECCEQLKVDQVRHWTVRIGWFVQGLDVGWFVQGLDVGWLFKIWMLDGLFKIWMLDGCSRFGCWMVVQDIDGRVSKDLDIFYLLVKAVGLFVTTFQQFFLKSSKFFKEPVNLRSAIIGKSCWFICNHFSRKFSKIIEFSKNR